jgi:hypothetical protein
MSTSPEFGFAGKSRYVGTLIHHICSLKGDLTNNRVKLVELVTTVNALILPKGWIGVDAHGHLHYTVIGNEAAQRLREQWGTTLTFAVDVIWAHCQWNNTVECIKDGTGTFEVGRTYEVQGALRT